MFTLPEVGVRKPRDGGIFARSFRFRYFLLAAAGLHLAVTLSVFMVGRFGLMPSKFATSGLTAFASDGLFYQNELNDLTEIVKSDGLLAWATWPTQLHVRIYSIPFVLFSRWTSFNILVIEPVNLFYYVAILTLVFQLGKTVFDRRSGLLAATIVGLWPTFLWHTTQLLRDPLLIMTFLLLLLSLAVILTQKTSLTRGLLWGLAGAVTIIVIRIVRMPMWDIIWVVFGVFICLLIIRQVRERSISVGIIPFACLITATLLITPHYQTMLRNQQLVKGDRVLRPEQTQLLSLQEKITRRREAFAVQPGKDGGLEPSEAGSNINNDVQFRSVADIVRYLPRAALVGCFAPFPNMWVSPGKQVGLSGRLVTGIESLLTYLIEGLAVVGFWIKRKTLATWLLAVTAATGVLALGLIVTNVGALYRLRYPFWVLIVIIGATAIVHWKSRLMSDKL